MPTALYLYNFNISFGKSNWVGSRNSFACNQIWILFKVVQKDLKLPKDEPMTLSRWFLYGATNSEKFSKEFHWHLLFFERKKKIDKVSFEFEYRSRRNWKKLDGNMDATLVLRCLSEPESEADLRSVKISEIAQKLTEIATFFQWAISNEPKFFYSFTDPGISRKKDWQFSKLYRSQEGSQSVDKKNWLYGWWTFDHQCGFWLTMFILSW